MPEDVTVGDLDRARVWVKASAKSPTRVVHIDAECRHLRSARSAIEKATDVVPDELPVCQVCLGNDPPPHRNGPGGLWQQLEAMEADDLEAAPR